MLLKKSIFKSSFLFLLLIISVFAGFSGCSDESEPVTPQSEHFDPEGWVINDASNAPVLVVWQGEIQKNWNGLEISDTLFAAVNVLSDQYSVKFLDGQKDVLNAPEDPDQSFNWAIEDTSKLEIIQNAPGDWAFYLKGKNEGKTNIELFIMHAGHVDVRTPKIPVVINNDSTGFGKQIGKRIPFEKDERNYKKAGINFQTGNLNFKFNLENSIGFLSAKFPLPVV